MLIPGCFLLPGLLDTGCYLKKGRVPLLELANRSSLYLPSPRWKETVEPDPGRFMHHFEEFTPVDFDEEFRTWLKEACEAAG
jgi:hypothetical protein